MHDLTQFSAHRCLTASGILIYRARVLLVFHKKLKLWLPPGGHLEPNELPHQAAEREFYEETGLQVQAISPQPLLSGQNSQYLPQPLVCNLHWINQSPTNQAKALWPKGCQQHYCQVYLVKLLSPSSRLKLNAAETEKLQWFRHSQLPSLDTTPDIKTEIDLAFQASSRL